ncbi:MAG: aminopeptidase P family protein [Clostridiales bacterium]|nr:aminopeptidase P family protein [Clostridiales bacterium]MBR4010101.1 aminopeptidase P family protein [Clostridiales bacterium]
MFTDVSSYRLPQSEYISRRNMLSSKVEANTAVVLFGGHAPVASLDEAYPFLPNRTFFYFCGIEQEDSVLILLKEGEKDLLSARLYIYPREPEKEKWTGRRLSKEAASEISGISDIRLLEDLKKDIGEILDSGMVIAWDETDNSHARAYLEQELAKTDRFDTATDISASVTLLRMVKSPLEVEAIRTAIRVTEEALEVLEQNLRPDMRECEATAILEGEYIRRGSLFQSFPTIAAGGENTLCLHYPTPKALIPDGAMLQIDTGARAGGYCSDISRAYAVNGKRDSRQQALFELICECKKTALAAIHPGATIESVNIETRKTAAAGLRELGVISKSEPDALAVCKNYYWHNTLHHMGLDVHDVCDREMVFVPGMVFAVEPGIYIPEWGFGFRVEDDVIVTANGSEYLSHPQV